MTTDTYKHTFKRNLSDKEKTQILDLAKASVLDRVNADVYLSWDDLHFIVPFWTSRQNLFAGVDKGKFTFDSSNTLTYQISHVKILIIGLIFAVTLAIGSGQTEGVLFVFGMIIVLNWLTTKVRHGFFFKDIVSTADTILNEEK